jgi:hypothetical protein
MKSLKIALIAFLTLTSIHLAGAVERPMIEADASERARVLKLVDQYDWAAAALAEMKKSFEPQIVEHKQDPAAKLATFPEFQSKSVHPYIGWAGKAAQAGRLYFLTGNEDYAQFGADILNHFVQFLDVEGQKPIVSTGPNGGRERDYRDVYPSLGLSYDYIHPFLMKEGTTVYDAASKTRIPFDQAKAQRVFAKIVDYGMVHSARGGNHEIMEFDSMLYSALCIEDKEQRDAYAHKLLNTYHGRNTGLLSMKQILIDNKGIWPESASYGGVGLSVPSYMEVIDRLYPEYKIFDGFEDGFNGVTSRLLFNYPSGKEKVAFGDSHRSGSRATLPEHYTRAVRRAGFPKVAERFFGHLKYQREKRGYKPTQIWSMDPLNEFKPKQVENSAVHLPFAGVVIQNNLNFSDPVNHGLMYYTGGANYVHAHGSGLDIELYGAGVVMSGVGGSSDPSGERGSDLFIDYYRSYAGHNTVVVNGESKGGKKGWKGHNLNGMSTVMLQAMEPKPYEKPLSGDFAFSCQRLEEKADKYVQERTVAMVRTSDTTGYYLDLFRSRSTKENRFHDYIYHNLGDSLTLETTGGEALPMQADEKISKTIGENSYEDWKRYPSLPVLYPGKKDKFRLFPGWMYFKSVSYSEPTSEPLVGRFEATIGNKRYMHAILPGGEPKEYASITAPPILEAAGKYDKKPAQVLSIRQTGEAWDRPFTVVFEPSTSEKPTVQSVENIMNDGKVVGAKVISNVDGRVITDWIIAQDDDKATFDDRESGLQFHGHFAIVRTVEIGKERKVSLYIGDGSQLSFGAYRLSSPTGQTAAFKTF